MKQPTNLVYLDNRLAQASYSLNLNEQRLLFLSLSKLNQGYQRNLTKLEEAKHMLGAVRLEDLNLRVTGEDFNPSTLFTVSVLEYAKVFDLSLSNARVELKAAAETLLQRYVTMKEPDGSYKKFHWVQGIEYDVKSDSIGFYWSIYTIPYIKDLQNYFTKLKFDQLLLLNSTYSWKLLTALRSKHGENKYSDRIEFTLEELLFILDVPESCKEFKHFNNLILKKVLKELQSKLKMTDLSVEQIREGRKIAKLVFKGFKIVMQDTKKLIN